MHFSRTRKSTHTLIHAVCQMLLFSASSTFIHSFIIIIIIILSHLCPSIYFVSCHAKIQSIHAAVDSAVSTRRCPTGMPRMVSRGNAVGVARAATFHMDPARNPNVRVHHRRLFSRNLHTAARLSNFVGDVGQCQSTVVFSFPPHLSNPHKMKMGNRANQ